MDLKRDQYIYIDDSVGKTYFPSGDSMVILRHHGKKEHQKTLQKNCKRLLQPG